MQHWSLWDRDTTYQPGAVVRHVGTIWRAARVTTGVEPGVGGAWEAADGASGVVMVDKADMAASRDPRIGRGL
jgi:chitodextrinase